MTGIGNHHDAYVAAPLAEKHRWMTAGKGLAATQLAAEGLGAMAPAFAEHERVMRAGLERLGIAWSGAAASAATAKLRAAATWAEQAGQVSGSGKGSVESYGNSFAATAHMVPDPTPVPDLSWWDRYGPPHWFDIQTDHDRVLQQNQDENAQAVLALDRHEQATRLAALGFPDQGAPVPLTQPAAATLAGDGGTGGPAGPGGDPGVAPGGGGSTGGHAGPAPGGGAPGGPSGGANGLHPAPPPTSPQAVPPSGPPHGPGFGPPPTGSPGGPTTPPAPPMVPLPTNGGGGPTGTGPGAHGSPRRTGLPGSAPPTERGPATPGEPRSGTGSGGAPAMAPGGRPGGAPAGLMPPLTGGAGAGNRGRDHRNNVFIPSDEPFVTPLQNDVTPPVLGLDGGLGDPDGFENAGARR